MHMIGQVKGSWDAQGLDASPTDVRFEMVPNILQTRFDNTAPTYATALATRNTQKKLEGDRYR